MRLSLDFESYSSVNLITCGVYRYVMAPDFDILCASYSVNGGPVHTWRPGQPLPLVFQHPDVNVEAWNAAFERLVWNSVAGRRYGFPPLPIERFRCTAARSRAIGAPGRLDRAARFFDMSAGKDFAAQSILKRYWAPQNGVRLHPGADDWRAITTYCEQDVRLEQGLADMLPALSPFEQAVYWRNEAVNDAGFPVDLDFVRAALSRKSEMERAFERELSELTLGAITGVKQTERMLTWLEGCGVSAPNLQEDTVQALLDDAGEDMHPVAERLLELRAEGAFAAISKYTAIANRVSADGRLRGAFVYAGAVNTTRFASYGVQLHNMRRDVPDDMEDIVMRAKAAQEVSYADLAACVRGSFIGNFTVGDFKSIEACTLPWLTLHPGARQRLMLFDMGVDIYPITAGGIYRKDPGDISKSERQVGKVADLSLGYQGGKRAFSRMASNYGVRVTPAAAEVIKVAWRRNNPWAPAFWHALNAGALKAISTRDVVQVGRLRLLAEKDVLIMVLPSGRSLFYHGCELEEDQYGLHISVKRGGRTPKQGAPWPRQALYGGLLAENATQAVARDVLANALLAGSGAVAHVHDEIVAENTCEELLRESMLMRQPWMVGLPLAVEVGTLSRYGKL